MIARVALYYVTCWSVLAMLVSPSIPAGRWLVAVLALVTTLPIAAYVGLGGWRSYPGRAFRLFVVRPVLYAQLVLPLGAAAGVLGALAGLALGAPLSGGRIATGIVLGIVGLLFAAGYVGSRRLAVRRVDATIPGLPAEFDGLRIAQVSDLHVGPHTSRRFLARVARTLGALRPDVIAATGDLVDDRAEDVPHLVAGLGALRAPLGVYLIPGNHDVYAGWDAVERGLRASSPATVLVNASRILERGSARLAIVGTGDPAARGAGPSSHAAPDIDRALRDVPAGVMVVALAHNPALWPALAERGVALTLSGHTHWGQFALPRLGWSLATPFLARAMGAHADGDSLLYIHPGTGYWGIPFRIGARPEVALITLHRGGAATIEMHDTRSPRRVTRSAASTSTVAEPSLI